MSATRAQRAAAFGAFLAVLGGCASADRVAAPAAPPGGASSTGPAGGVAPTAAGAPGVVISQVYGGGGNAGSTYRNDFIELFNADTVAVSLSGWSVQYASAAGTSWQVTNLAGTIGPGRYYLVQQAAGTGGTTPLPAPDATGAIAMGAGAGKVALVRTTAALTGSGCPVGASVADFVGYGAASCFEGSGPTAALGNSTAALRKLDGRQDTDNNAGDFAVGPAAPRNSSVGAPPSGPVVAVTVTPSAPAVSVGSTVALAAAGVDAEGNPATTAFTWSSSDAAVATVSAAGLVTGVAPSAAPVTITATAANGVQGSASVTVLPAGPTVITRVTFTTTSNSFPVGFQAQLFATAFSGANPGDTVPQARTTRRYEAATPDLATVDPVTGVITAVGAGAARFRVTFTPTDGGAPFTAEGGAVTVEAPVAADSASTYSDNLEFGAPGPTGGADNFLVRRRQFAASYNASRGQPNWVSYEYDSRQTQGGTDRCDCFTTDPLVVAAGLPAITTADYVGSGYSRGHMARSADRTRTNVENAATFYLTNIVPQNQDQNGGPWAAVENLLGDSVRAGRAVYIATGPQFNTPGALRYLNNAGKVAIPDSTWKVALVVGRDPATGLPRGVGDIASWDDLAGASVIAVMMPNVGFAQGLNADWRTYRRTVDQVEAVTGFDVLALLRAPYQGAIESGDRPPAVVLGGPASGTEGDALTFDAAGTADPDAGDELTYRWTFGDGPTAAGPSVTRTFPADGSVSVTLTVADRAGWEVTRTRVVAIANAAPVAALAPAATTVRVGQAFDPQARFTDPGVLDAAWRAVVDWGDGTSLTASLTSVPPGAIRASKVYAAPGSYLVRFTVTDKDGASSTAQRTVTVTP